MLRRVITRLLAYCILFVPKFCCFVVVVLRLSFRKAEMVILRVLPYCLLFVPNCRCFFLVVLRLASRILRMVIFRVWAQLFAICHKVSLFFANSFKVGFCNGTNGDT